VEGGIGDDRAGVDDSLLSKIDLNVLTDTLEAREFIEDLCAIEEIEEMVDILDTDDIFESLFFLSKICGLNKLDFEFTGTVSQSKSSSVDSEILSLFLGSVIRDCDFLSFSSTSLIVKFLGSKRSSLRFSRYSFKISLLGESNLGVTYLGIPYLGVAAGDGGIDVLSPVFLVSFGIKHGATTGDEVTGVSMGVIVSTPIFSIFDNLFKLLFIAETKRSSSLFWILSATLPNESFKRDGEVTTTNGLSTLSFLVIVLIEAVLFANKLLSDTEDTELLALMVEFEETVDDLD